MVCRLTPVLAGAVLAATLVACVASSETATGAASVESELATGDADASADASAPPRGPAATQMTAAVTAAGLDLRHLPASLHDLDRRTLVKVMQTFTTALGVDCTGCHAAGDYSTPTPQKALATEAYERIVTKLTMADGSGPLWCDSCHYGKKDFLDRSNRDALRDWMATNFVGKLARDDGQPMACTACHDTPP